MPIDFNKYPYYDDFTKAFCGTKLAMEFEFSNDILNKFSYILKPIINSFKSLSNF